MAFDIGKFVQDMDFGTTLQGVGALAGAWGNYTTGKQQNKLIKQQFNHQIDLDNRAIAKEDAAQENFDSASQSVFGKKKKTTDSSLTDAFSSTVPASV